jgi:hypothetical protein
MHVSESVKRFTVNNKMIKFLRLQKSGLQSMIADNMNKAAQQLGRLARGKKKRISQAERKRRADRLAKARKKRWAKKR